MLPTLVETAGKENVKLINAITGAEDFSFFQNEIPVYISLLVEKHQDVKRPVTTLLISTLMKVV